MHSAPRTGGKYPLTMLAGPYGHPFHPIAVIIPIAAWTCSVIFDLIAVFGGAAEPYVMGARILIVIGLLGAALAVVLGLVDWVGIPRGTKARATGFVHMVLNLVVIAIFSASLLLRTDDDEVAALPVILSIGALLILGGSGWLGGNLAHKYGVRVADERTQTEGLEPLP